MDADLSQDDFDAISAGLGNGAGDAPELPGFDLGDTDQAAPDKAPAAEPSVQEALEAGYDQMADGGADADRAWAKELRRMADEAIRAAGIDPSERHAANLSRRETVRRLFRLEQDFRADPTGTLERMAQLHAGRGDEGGRIEAAHRLLKAYGFEAAGSLAQTERQRLQELEHYGGAVRAAADQARQRAIEQAGQFVQQIGPEAFQRLRPYMHSFVVGGQAHDLESAYQMALKHHPELSPQAQEQAAAQSRDAERRARVAAARAASTPQTKSAPGRREAASDHSGKDTRTLLEEQWDSAFGSGG